MRTLRNAVQRGRVHHAYLFVGSRGTGKTSMAKILAACLNCERGPTVDPCGECESCRAIAQARSLDVIEMDAASNNSVDDIRELRESVAFAPVSGRSKVYILDEAHMLSTAAWNAFLKTLEEPPPGTVFVLATTEAQKVPATVVDRCHRFDFQRPTVEHIADVLRRAAAAESIAIPPEALAAVARAATGSFRDALGILEQLVTYSGREIALADVLAVLGATDVELLEETLDAVQGGDARAALLAVARCAERGRDAGAFAADLEVRARELLVVATLGEVPRELALTAEADARLAEQAGRIDQGTVVRVLEQLGAALEAVKAGADPRTQLELALVKAARPEVDSSLRALLARIERLERGAGQREGGVEGGPPGAARVALQARSTAAVASSPAPEPSVPEESSGPAAGTQARPAPSESTARAPSAAPAQAPTPSEPPPQSPALPDPAASQVAAPAETRAAAPAASQVAATPERSSLASATDPAPAAGPAVDAQDIDALVSAVAGRAGAGRRQEQAAERGTRACAAGGGTGRRVARRVRGDRVVPEEESRRPRAPRDRDGGAARADRQWAHARRLRAARGSSGDGGRRGAGAAHGGGMGGTLQGGVRRRGATRGAGSRQRGKRAGE